MPLSEHERDLRFGLPDPVLDLPDRERTAGTWMSHGTPTESVMMEVPGAGAFVRVLLPVTLTGGYSVTYGVWLGIHPEDLRRTFEVWSEPAYQDLRLEGRLANAVPPFGLLAAPVTATVRDVDETPYCTESSDAELCRVLTEKWDHATVLASFPDL
jgi:hypothetical protein